MSADTQAAESSSFAEWPKGVGVKTFKGRCHCGKITFEFDHPAFEHCPPQSCNCTLCTRTAAIYIYGPNGGLCITGDEPKGFLSKDKTQYFYFCPSCSNHVFWRGKRRAGINVRMFDDIDIEKLHVLKFDGRNIL